MTSGGSSELRRGTAVTLLGQGVGLLVSMASIVVLSRLLVPADFGVVAMVSVVSTLGVIIRDLGLSLSALRAPVLSHYQASNLFWANAALSLVASAAVAFSGPLLANIYHDPRVVAITPVMALSTLLGGLQAQVQVQLARSQRFGTLAAIDVTANVIALVAAIVAALAGLSYWALVIQNVVAIGVMAVLKFLLARWIPSAPRRGHGTKPLLISGLDYSATTVVNFFSDSAPAFMIGVNMDATDVGLYGRADQLIRMPLKLVTPLVNVTVPGLNAARNAGERIEESLVRIQSTVGFTFAVILVPVAAASPTLFSLILGSDWRAAAPVSRALTLGGIALALGQVNYWAFLLLGQSRDLLKYNLVVKPMTVGCIVAGSFLSLFATAGAISVAALFSWLIGVVWLARTTGIESRAFLLSGLRTLGAAAVALVAGSAASFLAPDINVLQVLIPFSVALLVYLGILSAFPAGRSEIRSFIGLLGRFLTKRGQRRG